MHIFLTGGTGFIGSALCQQLLQQGHRLTVLTRQPLADQQAVKFCHDLATRPNLNDVDAVINLAGEPIFHKRWTARQKQRIWASRIQLTAQLVALIARSERPPHTLLSGSATGIYGNLPLAHVAQNNVAKKADETTACGTAFPAQLCQQWERTAQQAERLGVRVCLLRTGLVLAPHGGALKAMLPLYRLGLGGKLASGKQHWAWISLRDQCRAIAFLLTHPECHGAYNLVAPQSACNADFNRQLAESLHRPACCTVPRVLLNFALGERAQLLLDHQPLVPQRLLDQGFTFCDPTLADYFANKK